MFFSPEVYCGLISSLGVVTSLVFVLGYGPIPLADESHGREGMTKINLIGVTFLIGQPTNVVFSNVLVADHLIFFILFYYTCPLPEQCPCPFVGTYMAGTTQKNLDKLQTLQNRGLRICVNIHQSISREVLHQRCKIPDLNNRRTYNLRKYMFRQKENKDLVIQRNIRTRRHDAVVYETCRPILEKYKKGTIYRGIMEWNSLDVDTRNIEEFNGFKKVQKNLMMFKTLNIE